MAQEAVLIFDIGKTNKKYFLFDSGLNQLQSQYLQIPEIADDDGFACDDLNAIEQWIGTVCQQIKEQGRYRIRYINFSTYGATLVHLDKQGKSCTPLYNYLKPVDEEVVRLFEEKHGGLAVWSRETASPFLGMLNAGFQLFWLKYTKPHLYKKISTTLFLPQYLSYRLLGNLATEFTGIGCHTGMWDFQKQDYHRWMYAEGFDHLLPPMLSPRPSFSHADTQIGIGIHDSSAALLTYLQKQHRPFLLLSTGTWSICFNPFNDDPLTEKELAEDCLCYLQPGGKQVKASRYFLGPEFTHWTQKLDSYFMKAANFHHSLQFDEQLYQKPLRLLSPIFISNGNSTAYFNSHNTGDLGWFDNYTEAYHHLMKEILDKQVKKIELVVGSSNIKTIYVDGGFASNKVFIGMLQEMLPGFEIVPSEMPLGTALGAALMETAFAAQSLH